MIYESGIIGAMLDLPYSHDRLDRLKPRASGQGV
jgi:hypothetical protein